MKALTPLCGALTLAVASTPSPAADAPSNLRLASPFLQDNTIEFAWQDNSDDEDGFEIEIRTDENAEPALTIDTVPNQTIDSQVRGGGVGTVLFARVRAKSEASGDSPWTENVSIAFPTTSVAILSKTFVSGTVGQPIEPYTPSTFGTETVTGFTASDLPPGLEIDPTTGVVSGTPTAAGVFLPIIGATDGTSTASTFVRFGIEPPSPQLALSAPLPDTDLALGSPPHTVDLTQHVSPGAITAFQLVTNHGTVDIIAFADAAPVSIANFRNYIGRNAYDNVVFHRSVNATAAGIDIIQAGWFKPDGAGDYVTVPSDPNIPNEPAFPNDRGTIAMAKQGGDAHSASSQFYFNVTASPALDSPTNNGGFSVFGRASIPSLPVLDAIHALPTGSYDVTVAGTPVPPPYVDWPTNTALEAGTVPAAGDLVQILSASELTTFVTYAVTGQSTTAVDATVDADSLVITPRHPGTSTITVTATDLDGNTLDATFTTSVTHEVPVSTAIVTVADASHPAITFPHLTGASSPLYEVQKSTDLKTWTPIWQTSDTFTHTLVANSTADGDTTTLTVRTPEPYTPGTPCLLRVKTTYPTP